MACMIQPLPFPFLLPYFSVSVPPCPPMDLFPYTTLMNEALSESVLLSKPFSLIGNGWIDPLPVLYLDFVIPPYIYPTPSICLQPPIYILRWTSQAQPPPAPSSATLLSICT